MKGDRAQSPDWTDFNRSDPGVTLLELFGYLAELLAYYQDTVAAEARLAKRRRHLLALGAVSAVLLVSWMCRRGSTDSERGRPEKAASPFDT